MNLFHRSIVLVFAALMLLPLATNGYAQEVDLRFEKYEELLNSILKTRRDEEKAFVGVVMQKVREGAIPERLVETSYKWVLNKRPDTKYPFVYFERVIRLQAKELGFLESIPDFDYDIYKERIARRRR